MQNIALAWQYSANMPQKSIQTTEVVARNLRRLMERENLSQKELARKSGVSQRSISNILNGQHEPGIEMINKLGKVFKMPGWQLQVPAPDELLGTDIIPKVIDALLGASPDGREMIARVAEREAQYSKIKP